MRVLRRGAEAEIRRGEWMGRQVLVKSRVPKGYRHIDLDAGLRSSRTKNEARLLQQARTLGVPTPIIFDIDLENAEIVMQELVGPRLKDVLEQVGPEERERLCEEIGVLVARLHGGGMTHGDLTTSNMILSQGRIWFIDFSLGGKNADLEEMGVDLHLLKEAFQSAHSGILDSYHTILRSYRQSFSKGDEVLKKVKEIERRGRYT